jgi:predicted ATPase
MLKRLVVNHFKSLDDFSIDFEPLTVLIGQNGSGKTTVLQALDLLGAFLRGDVNHYLERLGWDAGDLRSKTNRDISILFVLTFEVAGEPFRWEVRLGAWENGFRVFSEELSSEKSQFCFRTNGQIEGEPKSGVFALWDAKGNKIELPKIRIDFFQSILRAFEIQNAPVEIAAAVRELDKIFLLDLESVATLRKPSKGTPDSIGRNGQYLAAYLHSMNIERKNALDNKLSEFVPHISNVQVTKESNGNINLSFKERFQASTDTNQIVQAEHISDGTLRILALLATIFGASEKDILLLDEIENGIDPNHVAILIGLLEEAIEKRGIQVILATHSPLIVNFVPENGIRYFSRELSGNVVAKKLFDRKELKKMLEYMGPGEVWMNLTEKDLVGEE